MQTTANTSAATTAVTDEREPITKLRCRIDSQDTVSSTEYDVCVFVNPNATDTLEEKILRLIEREVLVQ